MALPHKGSWGGLPDFGITEAISGALGAGKTSQGGSNLVGGGSLLNQQRASNYTPYVQQGVTLGINDGPGGSFPQGNPGGGTPTPTAPTKSPEQIEAERREGQVRGEIGAGYDNYFQQLDSMMGGVADQRNAQDQILDNNLNQARTDLTSSRDESMNELQGQYGRIENNQAKTLRDLADSIMNQNIAGSVFLGAKGAGDSSASNMYSYALNKMGAKQRGDIRTQTQEQLGQVEDRRAKVNNIFTQETGRINTEFNNKKLEVAQWFANTQNQIKEMRANGELNKGKDLASLSSQLLSSALNQLYQAQTAALQRKDQLSQWASTTLNAKEGASSIATQGAYNPNLVQMGSLNGTPQVDSGGNISYVPGNNGSDEQPRSLFDLFS